MTFPPVEMTYPMISAYLAVGLAGAYVNMKARRATDDATKASLKVVSGAFFVATMTLVGMQLVLYGIALATGGR